MVENLVTHFDPSLMGHLVESRITSEVYAWNLLRSAFSEVLTEIEWRILWDNVLSNHPGFLPLLTAAYVTYSRAALFGCHTLSDFEYFFRHRNPVDIKAIIRTAYQYAKEVPEKINPCQLMEPFQPLPLGQYVDSIALF